MVRIGVTGTNGKTTTVSLAFQLLLKYGKSPAALGTLGLQTKYYDNPHPVVNGKSSLNILIKELVYFDAVDTFIFEAFSESIANGILDNLKIDIAAYTVISSDHLDYHESQEAYVKSKLRLVEEILIKGKHVIYNSGCHYADRIIELSRKRFLQPFCYGHKKSDNLQLISVKEFEDKSHVILQYRRQAYSITVPFTGSIFIENWMCSISICTLLGIPIKFLLAASENIKLPDGRLEKVNRSSNNVYIDYATNPHALEAVTTILRKRYQGRIFLVFGCGGDFKHYNRELMGKVANEYTDVIYITDDNPRDEEPHQIRSAIKKSCPRATIIADRKMAIETAMSNMCSDDVLLIAGKGHENYQLVCGEKILFIEEEIILNAPNIT